ncbi:hypothetical protein LNV23_18970 [Paucibacter sp. DJ1R-11]|uniref:hypothetical protein n=1 Tax=Paucibacter sp. DJ1R-11 TaxID=2893556 RepID=UPI0021E37268|nr:hypothetical protein [Paucibacter sp. DJ1R-11]MCV2365536.1 hypothetical protein [Paucibacter sp. DJ1R-11]
MFDFAEAQARLGASIARCMANAVLQVGALELPGNLRRRTRQGVYGIGLDAAGTDVEFNVDTSALLGLDLAGQHVNTVQRGQVAWWRVTSATPDVAAGTTNLKLEVWRS